MCVCAAYLITACRFCHSACSSSLSATQHSSLPQYLCPAIAYFCTLFTMWKKERLMRRRRLLSVCDLASAIFMKIFVAVIYSECVVWWKSVQGQSQFMLLRQENVSLCFVSRLYVQFVEIPCCVPSIKKASLKSAQCNRSVRYIKSQTHFYAHFVHRWSGFSKIRYLDTPSFVRLSR